MALKPLCARLQQLWLSLQAKLHVLLIFLCSYLLLTSSWLLMGRRIRPNASVWDHAHVYLGLVVLALSLSFCYSCCQRGKWRQYFPWLIGDFSQVKSECLALVKGKLPVAGGRGLLSITEGIGLLLLLGVGLSGGLWFINQGSSEALFWRSQHINLATGFMGFLFVHAVFACFHVIDMIRQQ